MQLHRIATVAALALAGGAARAEFDAAKAFGAREAIEQMSLSPDGTKIAYVAPGDGQGGMVIVLPVDGSAPPKPAMRVDGDPMRLSGCRWVSNDRLACTVYGIAPDVGELLPFTRMFAVNADGSNMKLLSSRRSATARGLDLGGGEVIDWLPEGDGSVLMSRWRLPDDTTGSRVGSDTEGYGVDQLDTVSLKAKTIEAPKPEAIEYITDGRGTVRVMGVRQRESSGYDSGVIIYRYRLPGSRDWIKLGDYHQVSRDGFNPYAVDHDRNLAYGFKKKDGRQALFSIALDGSLREELVFARPDVDVDGLVRMGRRNRVIGVTYATDVRRPVYFDEELSKLSASLGRALPNHPLVRITDSSVDESKLLIHAGSDSDPGSYYLLDRKTKRMELLLPSRPALEGVALAKMKSITYPAADGTPIPAYLTLPPGKEDAHGLPAIVMPHGGPSARDEWGFDWLSQFYAARGFAVLQPNFRGSAGYGDAWFQQNGFQSWRIAVGDVLDAGRWLAKEGIANPSKLAVVGWSYGGYAALQAAAVDPALFKAVVAIAPVTDLPLLRAQAEGWSNYKMQRDFIGSGPHLREGSPAQNAAAIKAPVMLFHGELDRNVEIAQSRLMVRRLGEAGAKPELVAWPKLDHYLDDSAARTEMLAKSDAFLRSSLGL